MDVYAHAVADAVEPVVAEAGPVDHPAGGLVELAHGHSRLQDAFGGCLGGGHHVQQLLLRRGAGAAHREGAGHVGRVAVDHAADVDHHEAPAQQRVVAVIVGKGGVGTRADDPLEGGYRGAVAAEHVQDRLLDLALLDAGSRHRRHAGHGQRGDPAGVAHAGDLVFLLHHAPLVDRPPLGTARYQQGEAARSEGRGASRASGRARPAR